MEKERQITQTASQGDGERARVLPDVDDVVSEWFSKEHPDWLRHECMWKDHNQYREYHKTI